MPKERVLVVDDEKLVRWSLEQKCLAWGYEAQAAEDEDPGRHGEVAIFAGLP